MGGLRWHSAERQWRPAQLFCGRGAGAWAGVDRSCVLVSSAPRAVVGVRAVFSLLVWFGARRLRLRSWLGAPWSWYVAGPVDGFGGLGYRVPGRVRCFGWRGTGWRAGGWPVRLLLPAAMVRLWGMMQRARRREASAACCLR